MKLNKKGSFFDILYIAIFLFVCGLVFTIGWLIYSSVNTEFQANTDLSTDTKTIMADAKNRYVATYDGIFLVVLVGLYIASLILAYNVDINPVFFFLSLLLLGVIVIITAVLGNAWYYYANTAELASYVDDFTIIPFVMGHYVQMFVVMGFGLAGVMYAKTQ